MKLLPFDLPLSSPVGPDFFAAAEEDEAALASLYKKALYRGNSQLHVDCGGSPRLATFIPGHPWGLDDATLRQKHQDQRINDDVYGPRRHHKVMVIGKMPGELEENVGLNFCGPSGRIFIEALEEAGCKGYHDFYVTNLVRFRPPVESSTLKRGWVKDCVPLLQQEIGLIRPEYILFVGTDASKELLGLNLKAMSGRVVDYKYSSVDEEGNPVELVAKAMTILHPANVARDDSMRRQFVASVSRFVRIVATGSAYEPETDLKFRTVRTLEELDAAIAESEELVRHGIVAADAEWHGSRPQNISEPRSGLRTIQWSCHEKHAVCLVVRNSDGEIAIRDKDGRPAYGKALKKLAAFFENKRVVGHYFNSDLEWLVAEGLDLRRQFAVERFDAEDGTPAYMRTVAEGGEGGADTGLRAHAIEETAEFGLKPQCMRYTDCPPWHLDLEDWLRDAKAKAKESGQEDVQGFGDVPEETLIPYGQWDACGTYRLYWAQEPLLDADHQGRSCREAFWESMIAAPAVLEMHQTGLVLDTKRTRSMTKVFLKARDLQEAQIRKMANWSDFNVRSTDQVKEYLYGERFNKKKDELGFPQRLRPAGALTLNLQPVMDTGKPPKMWSEIAADGKEDDHSPSTNKVSLAILREDNPHFSDHVGGVKNHRHIDTILKSFLRPPDLDKSKGAYVWDDDKDDWVFSKGIMAYLCDDGRVRTHFSQTKETGRWSSFMPNLQNVGNRAEAELEKIFKSLKLPYDRSLRSIFMAGPGNLLIDADFIGAELDGVAIMSGDQAMIDHCRRNKLDENHPDYYDLHSNAAVKMFKLDLEPKKSVLKAAGKAYLRDVAKTIEFGINYGRGAKAIVVACKEQGVILSEEEVQDAIYAWFDTYPELFPFFEDCKSRVLNPGHMTSCFGRRRRFSVPPDPQDRRKIISNLERQAMNFPIQSMIASAMSRALMHLMWLRDEYYQLPEMFRLVLQVHDSVVLEVPYKYAAFVRHILLPFALGKCVPIYRTDLDGVPTGEGPYYLGVESKIGVRWGESSKKVKTAYEGLRKKYPEDYWLKRLGGLPSLAV